jgi:hypothetical protein
MVGITGKRNPVQVSHFAFSTGQIIRAKVGQAGMATGSGTHLHQLHARTKEARQPVGPDLNFQPFVQVRFLGGDVDGAVAETAHPGSDTADAPRMICAICRVSFTPIRRPDRR